MKTRWILTILLIASLSFIAGCSKKEDPPKTPAESDASEATGIMDSMKGAVEKTAETVKESLSMDIDLQKAVSDLKAEAAKIDVKDLQKIAAKYKEAITEKMAALQPLKDKLVDIPMTEKLGQEARTLTGEIKSLTDAIAPLKERLGVYVDAIKAKGGDVTDLTL